MATEAEIVAFVAEWTGCPVEKVDPGDLLRSAGCDGDDAFELIAAFGGEFGVDLSGYVWDFHHEDEAAILTRNPLVRSPHQRVERIPLSATMLAGFAQRGRWDCTYPAHAPVSRRQDLWTSPVYLLLLGGVALVCVFWLLAQAGVLSAAE